MNTLKIPVKIKTSGRLRAVVHTGHEYDDFGNVVKFGNVLRETPFNKNKITLTGFNRIFNAQTDQLCMVAGAGNTAPNEADTTLTSYLGKSQTFADYSTSRNTTPDGDGYVTWTTTKRLTFGPGSLGGGSVNVAEGGIVTNVSFSSISGSTPISAHGLLVDNLGNPTTVSVNNAVEYLDIIWEFTEYVPASVTGTVTLNIDGVDVDHDYEVRPYYFDNTGGSFNYGGWADVGPDVWGPTWGTVGAGGYTSPWASNNFSGSLVAITGNGLGDGVSGDIPIQTPAAYVSNSKQRSITLTWLPTFGNKNTSVIRLNLKHTSWQISYDPYIDKVNTKQLDLEFVLSYANK